jgi:hypothetical protein
MKLAKRPSKQKHGFGTRTESIQQYIQNYLKQGRFSDPFFVLQQQTAWLKKYSLRKYDFSLADLLQCEHRDLRIDLNPRLSHSQHSCSHSLPIIIGEYGFWNLEVCKNRRNGICDFTLTASAGGIYRFHPVAIKNDIISKYGILVYCAWRSMLLNDLDCLKKLVEVIRESIDSVAPSIVCCPSSRRLCERVGIPVKNDIAFLFPSTYS